MNVREASVMGSFYPSDPREIEKMFSYYNKILDENIRDKSIFAIKPKAIISPHAGYVYSAFTANVAFRAAKNSKPKRAIVVGPSHKIYVKGTSIAMYDEYQTPFGNLKIDKTLCKELMDKFGLAFVPKAHHEHSTEVQMPFLKYYFDDIEVVELVYGDENPANLQNIIEYLLEDGQNLIVVSTDLSHYHDIQKANRLDSICLDAVNSLNISKLHQGCEACGMIGVEAMLFAAKEKNLKSLVLDYRTSADVSQDKSQVVGYMSAVFV